MALWQDFCALALAGAEQSLGLLLTVVLGIAGAFLATWIGQAIGWYRPDQGAGFIGATVGAVRAVHLEPTCRRAGDTDPGAGPR